MPRNTDSDSNRDEDALITLSCFVDCPHCKESFEVEFSTSARDEDGLADLEPGDVNENVKCFVCGHSFTAAYEGWLNYGDA